MAENRQRHLHHALKVSIFSLLPVLLTLQGHLSTLSVVPSVSLHAHLARVINHNKVCRLLCKGVDRVVGLRYNVRMKTSTTTLSHNQIILDNISDWSREQIAQAICTIEGRYLPQVIATMQSPQAIAVYTDRLAELRVAFS